ncbi:MAG: ImmA/IrrE family metallo-endopeptidase [Flavobacteriaceae bacterium]|nr:ImmA/IrrE family metallo-endopeptidase [Flavobacteriaceae bacterium]
MDVIATSGIKKANALREVLGLNMFQPVNVYDACTKLEVDVRFVAINMEGTYVSNDDPTKSSILLSALRPFPRKVFTCAHELGHHQFGHGLKIDMIHEENDKKSDDDCEERLADIFASALLMPIAGIQFEFKRRNWDIKTATPIQFFTISSVFGVGYRTLIYNCSLNKLISYTKSNELSKYSPSDFLNKIFKGKQKAGHLKIIDSKYVENTVDTEVSGFLYLPKTVELEGCHLESIATTSNGVCYQMKQPGILRANDAVNGQTYFIRIQNFEYIGLSEYRHLET